MNLNEIPLASTSTLPIENVETTKRSRPESILNSFQGYSQQLDAYHERRERVIKNSRDITALSKKLIFTVHRCTNTPLEKIAKESEGKFKELRILFDKVAIELADESSGGYWRYEKNISGGVQEFVEGALFHAYLFPSPNSTRLISSLSEIATKIPFELTVQDYLGGIFDLTGELMRLAINSIGNGKKIEELGGLINEIRGQVEGMVQFDYRNLGKKFVVLGESLAKVELAAYALRIREAEFADRPEVLEGLRNGLGLSSAGPEVEV